MMVAWWLLIAALVVLAVRAVSRPGRATSAAAEATLAERYARGEIDEPEFRARLAVLKERR
jgi:putative membrane protein